MAVETSKACRISGTALSSEVSSPIKELSSSYVSVELGNLKFQVIHHFVALHEA